MRISMNLPAQHCTPNPRAAGCHASWVELVARVVRQHGRVWPATIIRDKVPQAGRGSAVKARARFRHGACA
ncbi:MAG: hypothetical protein U0P82_04260 [Vicinamibacterales bacterium]